eukprot:1196179-Prorocentrum_minimum.AAC.2
MSCCAGGILQKVLAAIDAIYHKLVYKYASVYTKSQSWFNYYFSPKEQNKRKSNKIIFHPDANSVNAALQAFNASNLSWKNWADVTTKPAEEVRTVYPSVFADSRQFACKDPPLTVVTSFTPKPSKWDLEMVLRLGW